MECEKKMAYYAYEDIRVEYASRPTAKETNDSVGAFSLTGFPGAMSDIVISHTAWVREKFKGKGIGQKLHKKRILLARDDGATLLMCTVNSDNAVQLHIMEKFGWKQLYTFVSECTGNTVHIYIRHVNDETGMN